MKTLKISGAVLLLAAMVLASPGCKKTETTPAGASSAAPAAADDPVWIKVNGQDIRRSQIEAEIADIKKKYGTQMPAEQMAMMEPTIKRMTMQREVQEALLDQVVAKDGIKADPAKVDEELADLKKKFPDEQTFQQKLKEFNMTEDSLKQEISKNLTYQQLMDKHVQIPEPTDQEIQQVYDRAKERLVEPEQAKVTQILIMVPSSASEQTKTQKKGLAESIRKKIVAGQDMTALVQQYSDSPNKAETKGKETFTKGQMPEAFDTAVFALKTGQLSQVIETPMGYHIVRLDELVPETTTPLEKVRDQITSYLKGEEQKKAFEKYVDDLTKNATVTYLEPLPAETPLAGGPMGMGEEPQEGGTPEAETPEEVEGETTPEAAPAAPAPATPAP
jgi:peptidyl-prolyl cis-trans isomerase C